jgi:hypothetical protein
LPNIDQRKYKDAYRWIHTGIKDNLRGMPAETVAIVWERARIFIRKIVMLEESISIADGIMLL